MNNTGKRHPPPGEISSNEDQSLLFKVFRTSPVAITVHRRSDRRFAYVNSAFESFSGWKLEEVMGHTMAELNMLDADVTEQMGSALENEVALQDVEGVLTTRSDKEIHVLLSTELVDLQGVEHAVTTFVDVTQRGHGIAAEARLNAMWKSSLDALVVIDRFGTITDFNPAAEKIFGYAANDVIGAALAEKLFPPNDRERHRNGIKRFLASGDGPLIDTRIEVSGLRSDGREFPIELTVTAADEPGGPSFVATVRDLTARRQAEDALRESESRYRTLVDSAPEGIFIDQGKQVVFANPAFVKMLRAESAEEIIGEVPFTFVHPDYHDRVAASTEALSEVGDQTGVLERKFIRKDGSIANVEVAASKVLFEGRPAIQVYVRDVTERKQAQESLASQTEMLTTVTEALAEYVERGNWRTAMGRLLQAAVAETKSEYGFVGVVVGTTLRVLAHEGIVWDDVVNRDFYDEAMRSYEEVGYLEFPSFNNLFGRAVTTGQVVIANKPDGDPRSTGRPAGHPPMHSFLGVPIFVGQQVQGIVALANRPGGYTAQDQQSIETLVKHAGGLCTSYRQNEASLTIEQERVRAEAERLESLERFQIVARATNDAVWDWDLQTDAIWWNEGFQILFGYEPHEVGAGVEAWTERLHPADSDEVLAEINRVIDGHDTVWSGEYRFRRRDGSYADVFDRGYVIRDQSGVAVRMIGAMQDVTDRRKAEHSLLESSERLQLAVQASNVGLWDWDIRTDKTIYSREWKNQFGYAESEISDDFSEWEDRVHPDDRSAAIQRIREYVSGLPGGYESEFRMQHKDGSWRWIYARGEVFSDETDVPTRMLGCHIDITVSKLAEQELIKSEERYRDLVENARDIIYTHDLQGNYTSANKMSELVTGYSARESLRMNVMETVAPEYLPIAREMVRKKLAGEETTAYELEVIAKDGRRIPLEVNTRVIIEDGIPASIQGIARDVTERKQLESQLRQSQKLEAIGRLAGGVAHDFNNLLTAILGYSEMLMSRLDDKQPGRREIEEINRAGNRAAELTRHLLAFSRKQVLQPKVLDLNALVMGIQNLIGRLIGADVEIITHLSDDLGSVKADPGQVEQIIMNLVVNARDAMPTGGQLTIETANVEWSESYSDEQAAATPGSYVLLAVSDNGSGMDKDTQSQVFEPFFTTKELGKGTGLGLSTVYGIVKQSGGSISVHSEPGKGSSFKIYLPRIDQDPAPARAPREARLPFPGTETILLVEDEELVRNLAAEILRTSGYTVFDAGRGEEALDIYHQQEGRFDLVLTDIVMPGMSGHETARQLASLGFTGKFIFMTGYTENSFVGQTGERSGTWFLQKPFGPETLLAKIREALAPDSQ